MPQGLVLPNGPPKRFNRTIGTIGIIGIIGIIGGKQKTKTYGGSVYWNLVENTRTDYAVMGKIVRGPTFSFLGENKNRLFGTTVGPTFWDHFLDNIGPILTILDLYWTYIGPYLGPKVRPLG